MKKCLVLLVGIFSLILLTGCGREQKLSCTKDISSSGLTMVQTMNMNFIGDKVDSMDTSVLITLPDSYKSYMDTFLKQFKTQYENQYGKYEHVKLNTEKKSDSEILVSVSFDYKNMTSSEKKDLNLSGSEKYSVNKKTLEDQGFTCK